MKLKKIKDNISFYFFLTVLVVIVYLVINIFFYFDPMRMCHISIEGNILNGNKETIRQALKSIKKENADEYKMVCKYVDTISEKHCFSADFHVNPAQYKEDWQKPGCYVRGSKTIYILPRAESSNEVIEERAELIKKYSSYSKQFWDEY